MSEHRRIAISPRSPRRRGVPAYQLRRGRVPPAQRPATAIDDGASVENASAPAPDKPEASDSLAVAGPAAPRPDSGTEAYPIVEQPPSDAGPVAGDDDAPVAEAPDSQDLSEYARSVEVAAARSKLATPGSAPVATARTATRLPRGRPVVGHRVRRRDGRGNGHGGAIGSASDDAPRDPRPLLKRPRTWLIIVGMLAALAAIVAVLWTLNIARLTYDAYNEAHVESPERPRYRINPQGTPEVIPTEEVAASLPDWDNKDPFNILLMGIDEREGDTEPARSDTMIVVRVNPATNHVAMMSIPRDLMVYIPVVDRWDKMNAAYPIGEETEENGGPSVVMQTIERNFGVSIHYFVTIDFDGFRTVVDTIGGVMIDVRAPIKDDKYPNETFGVTREYFPTGLQLMDGETALRYSRTRYGDNDIMRGDRQQQMLVALREQAISLDLITRAEELIREFGRMVKTDLNFNQMLALGNLGRNVDPAGISRVNLWDAGVLSEHLPSDDADAFYMEADWPAVYEVVNTYFGSSSADAPPPTPTPATSAPSASPEGAEEASPSSEIDLTIPIIVQNDAGVEGLATVVTEALYNAGFDTIRPEAGVGGQQDTVIYDYAESPETARYIAAQLGLDESAIVYGNGGNGIVVSAGADLAWLLDR